MAEEQKGNGNPKMTAQSLAAKYKGKKEIYNVTYFFKSLTQFI